MLVEAGLPANRIERIPLSTADPGARSTPPSTSQAVLVVGRLDAEKGTRQLIELWRELGHDLELRVVGDGVDRPLLEAMQMPNVRFLGWMQPEDLRHEMLAARALVFPSVLIETFGLSMVEAFAAGLPVVANDIGTRREVVGPDGAGWLARSRAEWLERLEGLAEDERVDKAGMAGRARYEARFDPAVTLPQLVDVYESVLAATPGSA